MRWKPVLHRRWTSQQLLAVWLSKTLRQGEAAGRQRRRLRNFQSRPLGYRQLITIECRDRYCSCLKILPWTGCLRRFTIPDSYSLLQCPLGLFLVKRARFHPGPIKLKFLPQHRDHQADSLIPELPAQILHRQDPNRSSMRMVFRRLQRGWLSG